MKLRVGITPCPNDTFAFHAILNRRIDLGGLEPDFELLDVQQLNERLVAGTFEFAKASFHAALHLADHYGVLRAGSALGFGVGPLLLAPATSDGATAAGPDSNSSADSSFILHPSSLVLCPGEQTTATLLLRCLHPELTRLEHRLFSEIMPALRRGDADFGVVIHEGRFTYQHEGLRLVEDLGASWERQTRAPLPLGGILGRLDLPAEICAKFNALLVRSIDYAHAHRDEALATMRRHAHELDPAVLWSHVALYVNDHTRDLGETGAAALHTLHRMARRNGVIAETTPPLRILG